MQVTELNIEQISGKKTVSREDGRLVYEKIKALWQEHDRISVNFANLLVASVSFMDEAFGQLAIEHSQEELRKKLEFVNMSRFDRALLNDIIISRIRQRLHKKNEQRPSRKGLKAGIQVPKNPR
jgi:hypothetical protein